MNDDDITEHNGEPFKTTSGGIEKTLTGDCVNPSRSRFQPAYIEQSGTIGNEDGAERPVFVVVLETL